MFERRRNPVTPLSGPVLSALAGCALALLALALPLSQAVAAALAETRADVFSVRDVPVDATAATAAAAREQALATGQREAFRRLLSRLSAKSDADKWPKLSEAELVDLVAGFEVQSEKNSPVRYIATLTYHFKPQQVEEVLRDAGVAIAETPSKPVLVLPVLMDGDAKALWDDPNPWRAAWTNLPQATGLVPFVVPIGDIEDINGITVDQALQPDADKLRAIADRYGAGSALVAVASLRKDPSGAVVAIDLSSARYGGDTGQPASVTSVAIVPGETPDAFFARAARAVEDDVAERWKQDNLLHFDQAQDAVVSVPIGKLEDWLNVRRRFDQIAVISRVELLSLSRAAAQVDLRYLGDPSQLKLALAQRDLLLTEEAGGLVLRLAAAGAASP